MTEIEIRRLGADAYTVTLSDGASATTHHVTVDRATIERLAPGGDPTRLVRESFRFLLEREAKESILPSFDLTVIARYFPEYPDEIRRRLG